mgnify:CR=1 FL=1
MAESEDYEKILIHKMDSIKRLINKIEEIEEESWDQIDTGAKRRVGRPPIEELTTYTESLLFEFKSFLDIIIRYMNGSDIGGGPTFNSHSLNDVSPQDNFVNDLKDYYDNGISNQNFSINRIKKYRDAATHATILDVGKTMKWEAGDGIPNLSENFYILPDDPDAAFDEHTYEDKIPLFGLVEEIDEIADQIWKKLGEEDRFDNYDV